jgi:predicted cupin superfamily sugar epimerase
MPTIIPPSDTTYVSSLLSAPPRPHTPAISSTIATLHLQDHIEGGHFVETDRDPLRVPNPFKSLARLPNATAAQDDPSAASSETRNASTTIFYLVTPRSPVGHFHRNRARTVHTLHWGRGRYVVLHADRVEAGEGQGQGPVKVEVETFVVGKDIERGEKLQWIVEGGKFKASFLLPDGGSEGSESEKGCLISETVVPGFEYSDHDFMTAEQFVGSLDTEGREELKWLLKRDEQGRLDEVVKEGGLA